MRRRPRPPRRWQAASLWAALTVAWAACSHDWDSYDPRQGGGAATAGPGGAGPGGAGPGGAGPGSGGAGPGGAGPGSGGGGGAPLPGGTHLCSRSYGDSAAQMARAVAADPAGGAVVAGYFEGMLDLGGEPLVSAGGEDAFVAAIDAGCGHRFGRRYGDAARQNAWGVAADGAGSALVSGEIAGVTDFGGGAIDSGDSTFEDSYVLKLGPAGDHVWSRSFGDAADQFGLAVAAGPGGDAIVVVDTDGTIDLGCGAHTAVDGIDVVVARLAAQSGDCVWSRMLTGSAYTHGRDVAVDAEGNVYVGGRYEGTLAAGSESITAAGKSDGFVVKLGAEGGTPMWARSFGSAGANDVDYVRSLVVDGEGNVIALGRFEGILSVGLVRPAPSAGLRDVFLLKLDPLSGDPVWARTFGGPLDDNAHGLALDPGGGVVIAGSFEGTALFGGGPLTSAGAADVFVASFDAAGQHRWSRGFGGAASQIARGVAVGPDGVTVAGEFEGIFDAGGGPLTSQGLTDIFVARLAP